MTLLEKIKREIGEGTEVTPAELNGRPAWKVTRGSFEATIYQEAARVQIRHLDAYHAARRALPLVRAAMIVDPKNGCTQCGHYADHLDMTGKCKRHGKPLSYARDVKYERKAIAHFKSLSGFDLEV